VAVYDWFVKRGWVSIQRYFSMMFHVAILRWHECKKPSRFYGTKNAGWVWFFILRSLVALENGELTWPERLVPEPS